MDNQMQPSQAAWYALHCYAGSERKVERNLMQRVREAQLEDQIFQAVFIAERQVYPGYIMVEMVLNETTWSLVRETPGITGYVGSGKQPSPVPQNQVDKILSYIAAGRPKSKTDHGFMQGQRVQIIDGPFSDLIGVVDVVDAKQKRVVVQVDFVGRATPVELEFSQVEPEQTFRL